MERNSDNADMYRRYVPERRKPDRTGLWRVVAATGEVSGAVDYQTAGRILGAWRKRAEMRG